MKLLRKRVVSLCLALLIGSLMTSPAIGEEKMDPYTMADRTWISLSGTAVDTKHEQFTLDYGEGVVLVEMDDWDWYDESAPIMEGDKVRVYGLIDDDLFERTSIEASSVYVENMGTYFYANPADEESLEYHDYWIDPSPITIGLTTIRGTVSQIDGREFTIKYGASKLTVDTSSMAYNPLDDLGFQKIEKGDYISVTGHMDFNFWDKNEFMADTIITLDDDSDK